jgi:hypothetical protein
VLLKLDHTFYVNWLSENKITTPIQNALHYMLGVHPDSMGITLPGIKIKVEYLEARIRFLKDLASCSEEGREKFLKIIKDEEIISSKSFTLLIYQYVSDFPQALSKAYFQVTGKSLTLEDSSPIRQVYNEYAKFDLWTLNTACCLVSHMHPDSDALKVMNGTVAGHRSLLDRLFLLPHTHTYLFPNIELYNANLKLAIAAINAGKLKSIEQGFKGTRIKSVIPIEFLEWAKAKNMAFHPALKDLVKNYISNYGESTLISKKQPLNKLKPVQEDKLNTQKCAKDIWGKNPRMTIASMCKHLNIVSYAKNYKPETRRKWLSEIAPQAVKEKRGRPQKQKK